MTQDGSAARAWHKRLPPGRYSAYLASIALTVASVAALWLSPWALLPLLFFGGLTMLGTWDLGG